VRTAPTRVQLQNRIQEDTEADQTPNGTYISEKSLHDHISLEQCRIPTITSAQVTTNKCSLHTLRTTKRIQRQISEAVETQTLTDLTQRVPRRNLEVDNG